jgi:hypothetical protein
MTGFKARSSLLLLAIGTEVDRISAWNNPTDDPGRRLPLTNQYRYEYFVILSFAYFLIPSSSLYAKGVIKDQVWVSASRCAWKVCPSLAVHLVNRFKATAFLKNVRKLVMAGPSVCYLIPEAARFLIQDGSGRCIYFIIYIFHNWA